MLVGVQNDGSAIETSAGPVRIEKAEYELQYWPLPVAPRTLRQFMDITGTAKLAGLTLAAVAGLTAERADITDRQARVITEYLQKHFLSNTPTILPEKVMRFLRKHLWKSDFGESDLYLDIIYIPLVHRSLIPYLVLSNSPPQTKTGEALFVLYINTHQGVIPPWKIAEMAILRDDKGVETKAIRWQVAYVDGQNHHYQGLLSFPVDINKDSGLMEVEVKLPGMRKRIFQWQLPIPLFTEKA